MPSRAAVVHSRAYQCDIGPHVFPVRKYELVLDRLRAEGDLDRADLLEAPRATREELGLVHTEEYLGDLEALRWTPRTMWSELPLTAEIVEAYARAAGGTLLAAREALARGVGVNVGGGFHHAFADKAEGFCYVNDLAVAIRVLARESRIRRAAVVDLDVHQGNGTAGIFAGDASVFTLSVHQEANYPVPKAQSTLDIGLANGAGDAEYADRLAEALERVWAFEPDLLLFQAGADPFREDLLGGLALTLDGLEARDRAVLHGALERGVPAAVTLGGGYAQRVDDTVAIHVQTCRIAIRAAGIPAGRT